MKHTIREYVFWVFDFLKGSGIRKNYKDIVSKSDKEYNSINDLNNIYKEVCWLQGLEDGKW